ATQKVRVWVEAVTGRFCPMDFVSWVQSGAILVELVNVIRPGSARLAEDADRRPHKAQQANAKSFLAACADMGVPKGRLFKPSDLLKRDGKEGRIVDCLVVLGAIVPQTVPEYIGPMLRIDVSGGMAPT
ncbi:unnamed protein product, partial [Discosporangium mesarthrocarpum]